MKAIMIMAMLAVANPGTRYEIGQIENCETISTKGNLWNYDTDIMPGSFVVVEFNTMGTEMIFDDEIIGLEVIE